MNNPKWLKNAIIYNVYPQSFKDTNGDGIGDLKGIIEKLDYIKDLGCNIIWLNPIFVSPFRDAGYDVTDFYKVAPRYGTNVYSNIVWTDAVWNLGDGSYIIINPSDRCYTLEIADEYDIIFSKNSQMQKNGLEIGTGSVVLLKIK